MVGLVGVLFEYLMSLSHYSMVCQMQGYALDVRHVRRWYDQLHVDDTSINVTMATTPRKPVNQLCGRAYGTLRIYQP